MKSKTQEPLKKLFLDLKNVKTNDDLVKKLF